VTDALSQSKFFHEDDRICHHFCEVEGHIARNCPRRVKVSFNHNKLRNDQTGENKTDKNIDNGTIRSHSVFLIVARVKLPTYACQFQV